MARITCGECGAQRQPGYCMQCGDFTDAVKHRPSVADWYKKRDALHLERATLQAPILRQCGEAISAAVTIGRLDTVETYLCLVRTVTYTGYDAFKEMASELSELGPKWLTLSIHTAVPSLAAFIVWLEAADARLGTYPNG